MNAKSLRCVAAARAYNAAAQADLAALHARMDQSYRDLATTRAVLRDMRLQLARLPEIAEPAAEVSPGDPPAGSA